MFRASRSPRAWSPSRPRTRGDVPWMPYSDTTAGMSAPHPRGCSGRGTVAARRRRLGPAPAGMFPSSSCTTPPEWRRRTRGDAPRRAESYGVEHASAPHPQGCSHVLALPTVNGVVGPAPAGMLQRRRPP
ncbi:hypothetical protein GA0115250_13633 [Streptomyces sp. BvitLS-983]|nr:hypothetical protein GA0115250_13633 [Streptomyces sp. BvitLS-983]